MTKRKFGAIENSKIHKKIKISPSSPPSLVQLPTEILEKIIGNLSFWHRKNSRFTNTRLHDICDSQLWHEVHVALFQYSKNPLTYKKYATLKVLQLVTRTYSGHGFQQLFLGSLLSLLRQNYSDPFNISLRQVRNFLQKFYDTVDQSIGDIFSQKSKIMYLTTVVTILNEANNCCRLDLQLDDNQLHLNFEMTDAYFGMLWNIDYCQMRCPQFHYSSDKNDLLVVLSKILTMVECDTISSLSYDTGHSLLFLGVGSNQRKTQPKVNFEIRIRGPMLVLTYFAGISFGEKLPLPTASFAAYVKIDCREATTRWGSCPQHHLVMGRNENDESILREI